MAFDLWTLKASLTERQTSFFFQWISLPGNLKFSQASDLTLFVFKRGESGETIKEVYRATHDSGSTQIRSKQGITVSVFNQNQFKGTFYARGKEINWDIKLGVLPEQPFSLQGFGISNQSFGPNLLMNGHIAIGDDIIELNHKTCSLQHTTGEEFPNQWMRVHCSDFTLENGFTAPGSIEAYWLQPKVLGSLTPLLTPFSKTGPLKLLAPTIIKLQYQDKVLIWNKAKNFLFTRSQIQPSNVELQAEQGNYLLKVSVQAELRTLVGIPLQNTSRSVIYQTYTQFADLNLLLYNRGKLELSLYGRKNTSLELVTNQTSPYVEYKS